MPIHKPYRTYPLRTTLVVAVVTTAFIVMAMIIGWVCVPAYGKAKKEVRKLWKQISEQVAYNATSEVLDYFRSAPILLKVITGLAEENQLQVNQLEPLFDICYRALKENPTFMSVYYARQDGSFYGMFRLQNEYEGSYRSLLPNGKSLIRNYKIGPNHQWIQKEELTGDYDPRKRPFWKTALVNPNGGWSDPYQFATTGAQGYTYVLGQKNGAQIEGYWGVDFQIDELGDFLRTLKIGNRGGIYLFTDQGELIAESKEGDASPEAIQQKYTASGTQDGYFRIKPQIFYANQFPKESEIPWVVITSIHEDDFLNPIRTEAIISLEYGLVPCILFIILVGAFFGSVSRRLKEIAWEMDRVGNLSFDIKPEDFSPSRIREINAMNQGLQKMKIGLQSFSKYVPINLIRKLLFSGKAAHAGANKKEITVFFADLDQFTTTAEQLTPDEVGKLLEEFLTTASQEIHKENGIIDKFIGDAVMALWGTPDPIQNPELAACRAALNLKQKLSLNPRFKHKIGINTGPALVGNFGSEERIDYTAIGDTVNVGARLEKLNKQYGTNILIGPLTASAVEETLLVRPLQWIQLEGRSTPLLVYELLGEKKELPQPIHDAVALYASALEAYRHQRFQEAASLFEKANALFGGNDTPSKLLREASLKGPS